jgi:SAM-dependent methyltransferase
MNKMYQELAHLWPVISPPEGYALEACFWRRELQALLGPGRHRILELGVGGGHNLSHLVKDFEATGVDLSPAMLENARRLLPEVPFFHGDMRLVRLDQRFQAVLIHDAVAYLRTEEDLRSTFHTAALHLEPGGVLLLTPDHVKETFRDPTSRIKTARFGDHNEKELTFFEYAYDPDPEDSTYETRYVFLLREDGGVPRFETDIHTHGLFPLETWTRLLKEAGFSVEIRHHELEGPTKEGYMFVARLEVPSES